MNKFNAHPKGEMTDEKVVILVDSLVKQTMRKVKMNLEREHKLAPEVVAAVLITFENKVNSVMRKLFSEELDKQSKK